MKQVNIFRSSSIQDLSKHNIKDGLKGDPCVLGTALFNKTVVKVLVQIKQTLKWNHRRITCEGTQAGVCLHL